MEAATSFLCLQATSTERRCRLAWLAVARSLTRTQWPPLLPTSSLVARQASEKEKVTSLDAVDQLRRWSGLRLAVPCKHALLGGCEQGDDDRAQVTCLTYLPLAMLLASGYSNGRVRLWDPCARKHKIAPPPSDGRGRGTSGGEGRYQTAGTRDGASSRRHLGLRGEGSSGRHLRIWPGIYVKAEEEWTEEGLTFGCIASFGAVEKSPCRDGGDGGFVKVKALHSIVIPGGGAASLVVCDPESARLSRRMDEEKLWDPTSAGSGGGFFYLMCTGEVLALPSPTGFEERYVLLDDASFFEVSGPLGAQGQECAARFRGVFRARAGVLRVVYAASVRPRSVEAMVPQMNDTGVIAKPRRVLDGHFPGQRFAIFYREGDSPDRDITATIPLLDKEAFSPASIIGGGVENHQRNDEGNEVTGSAEFLRVEVAGRGHSVGKGFDGPAEAVSMWAVGRVSLRVEARSFDEPLSEDCQAAAKAAFLASWALKMQHLRALCSKRAFAARSRANAETRFLSRVGSGLRLCSLDRACGEEVADSGGIVALRQAVAAALRLPSRFPFASAHVRGGAYLQTAKVLRSLRTAEEQRIGGERGGATQTATLLWQGIKRAAYAETDPIARHFLRSIATPILQETLTGAQRKGSSAGRPIQWSGLRAALDASIDPDRATAEEAYTLLVRLGQAPSCHGMLNTFARKAEESVAMQRVHPPSGGRLPHVACKIDGNLATEATESTPRDVVRVSPVKGHDRRDCRSSVDSSTISRCEASSVLLGSSEIATLAAELDPLRRFDRAFAELEKAFGDEKSKEAQRRFFRSPLHCYAAARRCRGWHDKLEATGNSLATIRLRLGRRGQDLLTETRTSAAPAVTTPQPEVTADELIAEAKSSAANPARRQATLDGRNGPDHSGDVLTARVHWHASLPDRSGRAVRAFDGWGYYGRTAKTLKFGAGDSKDAGEAVTVLEVSPEPGGQMLHTGGSRGRAFGESLAFTASLLSVPDLREHPGLMHFYPGAKVIVDEGDSAAGGSGDCAAGGTPLRIVCERLEGWKSLRDVIIEHGPLAPTSAIAAGDDKGLRVLRLWGRQLASILEFLASRSLVLRDLRASTVFVSPDGSKVKVVSFSSLATTTSEGEVSPEAPCLDDEIHGPTKPLTPPEALAIRRGTSESSGDAHDRGMSDDLGVKCKDTLLLSDDEGPGAFRATTAWDTWTLGVLLFELAFGLPPPAFGASLGRAVAALTDIALAQDALTPELGNVARAIEYDFLSVVEGGVAGGKAKEGPHGFPPLAEALGRAPLGAATGARKGLHSSIAARQPVLPPSWLTDNGVKAVEGFRRAWVRRQLQMEESGAVDVVTWQMFQDKLKRHLDASVAAVASLVSRQENGKILSRGGDEGGGRRLTLADDPGSTATSTKMTTGAMAVDRIKARLSAADSRELGWLPVRVTLGVVRDELQLSFSTRETELITACLQDGDPTRQEDNRESRGRAHREGDVFYLPLLHVLLDSLTPILELQTARAGQALPVPISTYFEEILRACLEPDPDRRPRPGDLRHLPFLFSEEGMRGNEPQSEGDISAASAYMSGSGNESSPVWAFRERVERPIQACENADLADMAVDVVVRSKDTAMATLNSPCVTTGKSNQHGGPMSAFSAGALAGALKELERLVHREPTHCFVDDPLQARRVARGHAKLVDEVFESGVLVRATALALRFQDREESEAIGRGVPGVGFVEGDPRKTVGARVLLALARVLEELLVDLRVADSAVGPYADVVLRCLVTLFLGEGGFLAVRYGQIGSSPLGRPPTAGTPVTQGTRIEEGVSHWRPAISQIFEGLLVEAVGETGEGGVPFPSIQRYVRRCGLASHCIGAETHSSGDGDSDSEDLWQDGGGYRDFDCGGEGGRERGGARIPPGGGNEGWISSSEDENDDGDIMIEEKHRHRDGNASSPVRGERKRLVRSRRPPMFLRAPVYFAELLALGRVLFGVHRIPRGTKGGGFSGAADRARRQATAYCLTVVRMCCNVGSGGLDKTEPASWMDGGRELDEDATTMQRAQMMVDFRLAEKLAPCLHDSNPDVRNDAVYCALSAIRGGHARLRWISLHAHETEGMDPRALLALGFCTPVWVSALVAIVRGGGTPAVGSANPSRSTREAEDNLRGVALKCLRYMAAAGDLATQSWRGVRVVSALKSAITCGGPGLDGWKAPAYDVGRRNARDVTPRAPDFKTWKDGVLEVLHTLAENGSAETHSMLLAQGGQHTGINIFVSSAALTPKSIASRAVELLRGGTLNEIECLLQRFQSILATAVRIGDRTVLGYGDDITEDVRVTVSLVWGWMQRALVQLTRDEPDHPSTAARVSLVWKCLGLIRFVLCSPACRLAQCEIHPDLAAEISRAAGRSPSTGGNAGLNDRSPDEDRELSTAFDIAAAHTGLEATVLLLSAKGPAVLDLYRAHPISALTVGAADVLADALTYGDRETIESVESSGMGLRLGLAIEASTRLVRDSRRLGVEDIHLLPTYPGGRRARTKLLDRILWRAHRKLREQVIISGLVEFIVSNMLPDCATTDIVSTRLPANFMRYNGTPLIRNEGIALLERIVTRRHHCPSVAREMGRQAVRHELSSAEPLRLRRYRHRSIRAGVSACLRCLARLDSSPIDNALTRAGVPRRTIVSVRRDHTASKTRRQWTRWIRHYAESGTPPDISADESPRVLPDTKLAATTFLEDTASGSEKVQAHLHDESASDGVQRLKPPTQELRTVTKFENRSRIKADRQAGALPSFRTVPVGSRIPFSKQEVDAVSEVSAPTNAREVGTVLTIEGSLSTLSVRGLIALIATELEAKEHSIRLIEVGGVSAALRPSSTAHAASPVVDECVLKLSLPEALADCLHTRCLGGVLRVPGLLSLEVEGRCKLAWNGEEIVPDGPFLPLGETSTFPYSDGGSRTASSHPRNADADDPLAAGESTKRLNYEASILPSAGTQQPDVKFSWLGQPSLGAAAVAGLDRDDGFVRSGSLSKTNKNEVGRTSSPAVAGAMTLDSGLSEKQRADLSLLLPTSPREQRARVATALDRMGAGVIEVREAFQRWVPPQTRRTPDIGPENAESNRKRRQPRARDTSAGVARLLVGNSKREVNISDSANVAPDSTKEVVDLNGGVMRAMMELRLPVETAEAFCEETGGVGPAPADEISFSGFVARYADAAGLLAELMHGRKGGEVWVEGPGGRWVAVSRKESEGARRAFHERTTEQEQGTKSDDTSEDGGKICAWFVSEKSLGKADTIAALQSLRPEIADGFVMKKYFDDRGRVIDELFGGRVSFQEFVRAIVHLKPTAVAHLGGAGTTTPKTTAALVGGQNDPSSDTGAGPASVGGRATSPPTGYFDGMPGRVLGGPATHRSQSRPFPHDTADDNAALENRYQGGEISPGALATAARLRLRREREDREERRAWAQRTSATRHAPASQIAGGILKRSSSAATLAPPSADLQPGRNGSDWSGARSAGGVKNAGGGSSVGGGRSLGGARSVEFPARRDHWRESSAEQRIAAGRRGRTNSAEEGTTAAAAASTGHDVQSDSTDDAVSRAFRRYAEDRDLDRGRGRSRDGDNRSGGLPRRASPHPRSPPARLSRRSPQHSPSAVSPPAQPGTLHRPSEKNNDGYGGDQPPSRRREWSLPQEDEGTARLYFREGGSDQGSSSSADVDAVEISGGDEGGGHTRPFGAAFVRGRKASLEGFVRGGGRKGAGGVGRDGGAGQGGGAVDELERDRALRQAFDMYDLNGDGFITYLELKAVLRQRGGSASDVEVRTWIEQRDTSGTGAVDFADFSRAFEFASQPENTR